MMIESSGNTRFLGNYTNDGWSYNILIRNILPK